MACVNCDDLNGAPDGSIGNPFVLRQGKTFRIVANVQRENDFGELVQVDLSTPARTGRAQLRSTIDSLGAPIATLTITNRTPQTGSNRGLADVTLGATVSQAPQILAGQYVLDVEFVNDADADDVIGSAVHHVRVDPEVTK